MVVGLSRQDWPIHYNLYRVNRLGNNPLAWVHTPHSKLPIATANATSMCGLELHKPQLGVFCMEYPVGQLVSARKWGPCWLCHGRIHVRVDPRKPSRSNLVGECGGTDIPKSQTRGDPSRRMGTVFPVQPERHGGLP